MDKQNRSLKSFIRRNDITPMSTHQELKARFVKHMMDNYEDGKKYGLTIDPVMEIADFWLDILSQRDKELVEALEGMKKPTNIRSKNGGSAAANVMNENFNEGIDTAITLINSRSKENPHDQ